MRGAEDLVEVGLFFDGAYGSPFHQFGLRGDPLALLDAMRASVSNANSTNTSDALRAWVRAGMPDTASQ